MHGSLPGSNSPACSRATVPYYKHGFGCRVALRSGNVDFNFGAHGEIDQFDCYRLYYFARGRRAHHGFADEQELREAYRAALQSGAIEHADEEYTRPDGERTDAGWARSQPWGNLRALS